MELPLRVALISFFCYTDVQTIAYSFESLSLSRSRCTVSLLAPCHLLPDFQVNQSGFSICFLVQIAAQIYGSFVKVLNVQRWACCTNKPSRSHSVTFTFRLLTISGGDDSSDFPLRLLLLYRSSDYRIYFRRFLT